MGQEQVLAERYTLVSPLGRGGMGQVWEALDTRLDRKVAVKLLTAGAFPASPDDGLDARRFTREAAVTAGFVLLFGGLGAWLSFGYIAARHQRLPWLAAAAAYLALTVLALALIVVSPDAGNGPLPALAITGVSLLAALWPAAIIHALWVNFTSRLPLLIA